MPVQQIPVIKARAAALEEERQHRKLQPISAEEQARRAATSTAAKATGAGTSKNPYKHPNARAVGVGQVHSLPPARAIKIIGEARVGSAAGRGPED
ncbi:hypothetical protein [Streptomyces triculaminicus]|uniref:hypothetical protein n=1 Tax=Streptomyces triculaminicus TaxID=2816232 RepID=UPI0037B62401